MEPMYHTKNTANVEERLRVMRVIWAALFASVGLYALLAFLIKPPTETERIALGAASPPDQSPLLLVFLFVAGFTMVVISFVAQQSMLSRAVREQRPDLVQSSMIVALVLCETTGLFGLLGLFLSDNRYLYLLFVVSAAGILMHFPRREHLLAASFRGGTGQGLSGEM